MLKSIYMISGLNLYPLYSWVSDSMIFYMTKQKGYSSFTFILYLYSTGQTEPVNPIKKSWWSRGYDQFCGKEFTFFLILYAGFSTLEKFRSYISNVLQTSYTDFLRQHSTYCFDLHSHRTSETGVQQTFVSLPKGRPLSLSVHNKLISRPFDFFPNPKF